jgi:hypothetical protein
MIGLCGSLVKLLGYVIKIPKLRTYSKPSTTSSPTTQLIDFLFAIPSNACHPAQHTIKRGGRLCSRVHDVTNTSTGPEI